MNRVRDAAGRFARKKPVERVRQDFYQCPGCGKMVDNRDWASIRFHHDHVLHPRLDVYVTLPTVSAPQKAISGSSGANPSFSDAGFGQRS